MAREGFVWNVRLNKSDVLPLFSGLGLAICILGSAYEKNLAALLAKFMPAEPDKGFVFYVDFVRLCLSETLWIASFMFVVWIITKCQPKRIHSRFREAVSKYGPQMTAVTIAACLAVTILVSHHVLETFPNSADEYVYLHQAETLSKGRLSNNAAPIPDAFQFNHIADKEGTRVGRFPPGWPLLLSTSFIAGLPTWVVNPVIALITLIAFFSFARKLYGTEVAWWSVLILSMSGFFIYNSASFFSHSWSLLLVLVIVWMAHLYVLKVKPVFLLIAGLALGMLAITRYFTAVLVFIPVGLYLIHKCKRSLLPVFLYIFLGAIPGILFLAWYNYEITGNPITPVTAWAYDNEGLGFVNGHNFVRGLEHSVRRLFMFIYWCSPGVLLLYFIFLWQKIRTPAERWLHPEDYIFVILFVGHFFYHHLGGNQYGPRFVFEALPFMILFVVKKVHDARHRMTWAVLLAGLFICMIKLPFISAREATVVEQRKDLFDLVERARLVDAVVFVASPTGTIRPMPVEDLTRNDLPVQRGVIFLREIPGFRYEVMTQFEGYSIYRYEREVDSDQGRLTKLR